MSKLIELEYEDVYETGACTEDGREFQYIMIFDESLLDTVKTTIANIEADVTFAYAYATWFYDVELDGHFDMGEGYMSLFLETSIPKEPLTALIRARIIELATTETSTVIEHLRFIN